VNEERNGKCFRSDDFNFTKETLGSAVRVTRSLVLYVCFVHRCLSFCTFSFGHCVVCSSIYRFWLPLWYSYCSDITVRTGCHRERFKSNVNTLDILFTLLYVPMAIQLLTRMQRTQQWITQYQIVLFHKLIYGKHLHDRIILLRGMV
jgi:hypothetical protein